VLEYGYHFLENLPYMASQVLITRIVVAVTSFIPLSCQSKHGYMVTIAHRVVPTGMRVHPPPLGAAASAPPAGAQTKLYTNPN
jgi:hypothetical protein